MQPFVRYSVTSPGVFTSMKMFATTFKPEKPQQISSQLQKTSIVKNEESLESLQMQQPLSKDKDLKLDESLAKEKKKDLASRILSKYMLGEKRVRSMR